MAINFDVNAFTEMVSSKVMDWVPKLAIAIVLLILGIWIINIIAAGLRKGMSRKKVEPTLKHFLLNLFKILLKVLLVITVISMVGVPMTSFIAVLGAAGLAIGLALQGSLSNFAGGVLILMFRPFRVGDLVEAQGYIGKIKKIQVFHTIMTTLDNKTVILPNGDLANSSITNYTTEPLKRVDMKFGIGYGDDIKKARAVIDNVIKNEKLGLKDPAPTVSVSELGDSSVNFTVRVWSKTPDYWQVYWNMHENIKIAFDQNNISIPFPQRDVHMYNHRMA